MKSSLLFALFAGLALTASPARAGAPEAMKMLQENRVAEAKAELERGAAQGDPASQGLLALIYWHGVDAKPDREKACATAGPPAQANEPNGQAVLARCYFSGIGGEKDLGRARELAHASALAGNNEGRYIYYGAVISDPALSFLVDGKVDETRYKALAARPVDERTAEIEALDLLAKAVEAGHRESRIALAMYFLGSIGDANKRKARFLFSGIPLPEHLLKVRQALEAADATTGRSLATLTLMHNAQTSAIVAALVEAYPPGSGPQPDCKDIRLKNASVVSPPQDALYLPHGHPSLERSYLVRGRWQEAWLYSVCGKDAVVYTTFQADGLAGASFSSQPARQVKR